MPLFVKNPRAQLLAAAAELPPGERIPDALLFGEGLDPTDTFIGELVRAAPGAKPVASDDFAPNQEGNAE